MWSFVKITCLLASTSFASAFGQNNPPTCYQPGECTQSLYIGSWPILDIQTCLEQCQSESDCQFFTFKEDEDFCVGFANCVVFDENTCENCYSGSRNCEDVQCSVPGICNGILIDYLVPGSNEACVESCQSNQSCQWATFNYADGNCTRFESCPILSDECGNCVSSQRHCYVEPTTQTTTTTSTTDLSGYSKLFVVAGFNGAYLNTVQVIQLEDTNESCLLEPYPRELDGPAVGFVNNEVKSCGGNPDTYYCYDYNPSFSDQWESAPTMIYPRFFPRASVIDGEWLVTGDDDSPGDLLTEVWIRSVFVEAELRLPERMYLHCQITINNTALFFADVYDSNQYYILNWPEGDILAQGLVPDYGVYESCGLINNPENGQEVVVAGYGFSDILNLATLEFRSGPPMPAEVSRSTSVQYQDTFLLVGGYDGNNDLDTIYKFDNLNYGWILLEHRLVQAANLAGATVVPNDFVNCS